MFWKQFFFNHRFKSYFIQMVLILFKTKLLGDLFFLHIFFNYSLYCFFNIFFSFFIEFNLFFFLLFNIIFIQNTNNKIKYFFYFFLSFLSFLIICSYFFYLLNINIFLLNFSLQNNYFTFLSKVICLCLLLFIFYIIKNKLLNQNYNFFFKELVCVFCFLLLFICILISSIDFFIFFISLEGISFVLYTLGTILNLSYINLEAIIKYFLINNIASSLLLWTISYIYLIIGTTDIYEFKYYLIYSFEIITLQHIYPICFLLIICFLFKLAIFPFHWWIADIYEGFWTPLTLIYAILIKYIFFLFFFFILLNVLSTCFFLKPFVLICSFGSILFGSIGALVQVKIKRFLAYTSISQSGYILLGVATNTFNGFFCSFLYLNCYTIASLCFFLILLNLEHIKNKKNITYLNQLYSIFFFNKEISLHLISIIFIMAALPPFNSFFLKFFILILSLEIKMEILVSFILLVSLISTFYYLNFIQQLIFFKINKTKIYLFNYHIIYLFLLRLHVIILIFPFIFWSKLYIFSVIFLGSCLWPLSFCIINN